MMMAVSISSSTALAPLSTTSRQAWGRLSSASVLQFQQPGGAGSPGPSAAVLAPPCPPPARRAAPSLLAWRPLAPPSQL